MVDIRCTLKIFMSLGRKNHCQLWHVMPPHRTSWFHRCSDVRRKCTFYNLWERISWQSLIILFPEDFSLLQRIKLVVCSSGRINENSLLGEQLADVRVVRSGVRRIRKREREGERDMDGCWVGNSSEPLRIFSRTSKKMNSCGIPLSQGLTTWYMGELFLNPVFLKHCCFNSEAF